MVQIEDVTDEQLADMLAARQNLYELALGKLTVAHDRVASRRLSRDDALAEQRRRGKAEVAERTARGGGNT